MRKFEIKSGLYKDLKKLFKKNKDAYEQVMKKINEIINSENIDHYKNLRYRLKNFKRVHVDKHFVLIFTYDKSNDFISFVDYDHHDNIYRKY